MNGRNALPQYVVYAISKRAIETLTVVMVKEFGPKNISVNRISPGLIACDSNVDIGADEGMSL